MRFGNWKWSTWMAAALVVGCSSDSGPAEAAVSRVTQIAVSLAATQVDIGQHTQASASLRDASGAAVGGKRVVWASSNSTVATIDSTGMATGLTAGATTITATSDDVVGSAPLIVAAAPVTSVASVSVNIPASNLAVGAATQASAVVADQQGNPLAGRVVTWASSDAAVAAVNQNSGQVTGVAPGTSAISATSDGVTGTAVVTVFLAPPPVASVSVALEASTLDPGETTQATAGTLDENGNALTGREVQWTSSNASVATVANATGVVTALAPGTTTISATSEGKTGTASLTVAALAVATVTVALDPSSTAAGGTSQATATPRDVNGAVLTGRPVVWTSVSPTVATVSEAGLVTALAAGTTLIRATIDGQIGNTTFTVSAGGSSPPTPPGPPPPSPPPVATVSVSLAASSVVIGGGTQATATTKDASGTVLTGRTIAWASSNPSVASIDGVTGAVEGVAAGTATLTATSETKSGSATITVTVVPVASVSVSLGSTNLVVGATTQATASPKDAGGHSLTGRTVTWTSSNTAAATVSSAGLVTGIGAGSANITATSETKSGHASVTVTVPIAPVASVTASLGSSSIVVGATTQATAVTKDAGGHTLTGRVVTWTSSNAAAATVNASTGVVSAAGAGTSQITATSEGKTGSATVTVTVPVVPVATVSVSLSASSILAGAGTQATATTKDAGGNTLTGRVVTWTSSNTAAATVNASTGAVAGVGAGSSNIVATSEGKTGSASVTVTAPPPVATKLAVTTQPPSSLQSGATLSPAPVVQLRSASNASVSQSGVVVTASIASGSATLGGTLTATTNASGAATFSNLTLSGSGAATLRFSATGLTAATSGSVTVNAASSASVLFEEKFDDASLASRGWYDLPGGGITSLTSTDHISGSTQSLMLHFDVGGTTPSSHASGRHQFTASEGVYFRYWVKYSSNWVGSGKSYHPHEFHFLTTEDDAYVGPSSTHLTTYIEENFQSGVGSAVLGEQDAKNIDQGHINQDVTNSTENRAVGGCNGNPDGSSSDCYADGSAYVNGRLWRSGTLFTQNAGAGYKGDWHMVEVYLKMNSIVGGKGQLDGVAQYWFDGQLAIDRHNVIFRTGAHPTMKFNQFLMAPYIGDGSPASQTMWIDDIVVMTGKP
jgi:uncharacterized protein YjdB